MATNHHAMRPIREFKIGNTVFSEDFTPSSQRWIEGIISDITGLLSYKIKLTDGTIIRRNVDSTVSRKGIIQWL